MVGQNACTKLKFAKGILLAICKNFGPKIFLAIQYTCTCISYRIDSAEGT